MPLRSCRNCPIIAPDNSGVKWRRNDLLSSIEGYELGHRLFFALYSGSQSPILNGNSEPNKQRWRDVRAIDFCRRLPVLLFAYGFEHELLGVLDERPAQVSGRLEPVDGARQDHAAGSLPVDLWLIHARGNFAPVPQGLGGPDQTQASADDHDVARAEVLL